MSARVLGDHEAAAMFEAIADALGALGSAASVSGEFLRELQAERELLIAQARGVRSPSCGCDFELVEDGSVQRKRWFHEPGCVGSPPGKARPF